MNHTKIWLKSVQGLGKSRHIIDEVGACLARNDPEENGIHD